MFALRMADKRSFGGSESMSIGTFPRRLSGVGDCWEEETKGEKTMITATNIGSPLDSATAPDVTSKTMRRIGYVLSALPVLFLLMDAAMKLLALPIVLETSAQLGYPATPALARVLGTLLLACTLLYVYPRTCVLGAVLLTAFLGGTVATHVRVGSPLFTHTLFGLYLGVFLWGGLFLRDARLRAQFPWRR
jgi:hypothetical protein